jgi:hypothetical protein
MDKQFIFRTMITREQRVSIKKGRHVFKMQLLTGDIH